MNVKRHCDLCEHQVLNLKRGTICGLTNKKPNFNTTCLKIKFDKKIKIELENLLVDLEIERTKKKQIISNLIVFIFFGGIIMIGGYLFLKNVFLKHNFDLSNYNSMSSVIGISFFIILTGFILFTKPIIELIDFNKVIRNTNYELFKIEEVLKRYSVTYKYDIEILKEVHETQEYSFEIEIIKK